MIKKVGVVGAGMMGSEIALCFAMEGIDTILCDTTLELAEKGVENQATQLNKRLKSGKVLKNSVEAILNMVTPTGNIEDLAKCDIVFEAVTENVDIKRHIFIQLDRICKIDTIIASNTSSIPITKLSAAVSDRRRTRFVGTHFNSPASVMKLVEVVPGLLTSGAIIEVVYDFLKDVGKEPVKVKDVVGFALNRMFHCFYLEACRLIEEGVCSAEDIDKICIYGLGHPMGICSLLDITSHDLNISVDEILFEAYGERFRPSPLIRRMVDSGRLGKKTGMGFYDYSI